MLAGLWTRAVRRVACVLRKLLKTDGRVDDTSSTLPLARLMAEAEPPAELFDRIEAKLDSRTAPNAHRTSIFESRLLLAAAVLLGVLAGIAAAQLAQDRLPFHATTLDGKSSGVLGQISVHGASMRLGLQEFCRDADHLSVLITAQKENDDPEADPHIDVTRKFLIPCNH